MRQFAAGAFALRLGTDDVALLAKAEGGVAFAKVITENSSAATPAKKHLGPVRFEEFALEVGASISAALSSWICDSWRPAVAPRDGALVILDHALKNTAIREFTEAIITATVFPALDASSKESGKISIHFDVASVTDKQGTGKAIAAMGWKPKLWQSSAFRLEISGIDCTKVTRVDSFAVERRVIPAGAGSGGQRVAGPPQYPNLSIAIASSGAQSWVDWHRTFVLEGKNDDRHEREGAIILLAPNLKSEIARIALHNVGIARLSQTIGGDDSNPVAGRKAEIYCESMELMTDGGHS